MKIAIGSDHVGVELKPAIIEHLKEMGHEVEDFGPETAERTDYPIYGIRVAEAVAAGDFDGGVLICGTGVGISISANKVKGIRAACCSEAYSAKLSKMHNNANILCFGARVVGVEVAKMMVDEWINADYEGGRHSCRVQEIMDFEEGTWSPADVEK